MDTSELHFINFDPDLIWEQAMYAYIAAGGDILYPGDAKEMILRAVQAVVVQNLGAVDNALRMDTLQFSAREFLDIYGIKKFCSRIPAVQARCTVEITFREGGGRTIEAGTALTADGERLYVTESDIVYSGEGGMIRAEIICSEAGAAGNGLIAGTQMQFMVPVPGVVSVYAAHDAAGGQDAEDDETYRERIHTYGMLSTTTGTKTSYEAAAMAVSSEILDAETLNTGAGTVTTYLIVRDETHAEELIGQVKTAQSPLDKRPLTDVPEVQLAPERPYRLIAQYRTEGTDDIRTAMENAAAEYQKWQDETIGRHFNPDKLMAMLYQAGAMRVVWGEGSHFDGGSVQYSEMEQHERCKGEITLEAIE